MRRSADIYREYRKMAEENASCREELEQIRSYMKASTAIHHGEYVRTCYNPKLFTGEEFQRFS